MPDGTARSASANVIPIPLDDRRASRQASPFPHRDDSDASVPLPGIDGPFAAHHFALALGSMLHRPRSDDCVCALAIIRFAEVRMLGETLSGEVGRELGGLIRKRLANGLRSGDTLLQIDQDAYTVLLDGLCDRDAVAAVLRRLQERAGGAYRLDELRFHLTTKVGVALYPDSTTEPDELLRFARVALRHASACTVTDLQFFDPQLLSKLREQVSMTAELRGAIEAERLELLYQPLYAADTGELVSAEALLRLRDRAGVLVAPDRFIGIAEDSGLIVPIGHWVIREACRQLAEWRAAGLALQRIAVNLSPRQLHDEALIATIRAAVEAAGIAYGDLELELTERQMVDDVPRVAWVLEEIAALGVRIAVDDFGAGYSALAYLSRLPLHMLKIDRSFIHNAVENPRAGWLVGAIVAMAKDMRLEVTAEGIETEAQRQLVAEAGCDLAQGFHLARPMPPEQLLQR